MYQTKHSSAYLLVFHIALYVSTPVRSQHPYGLISAIVDKENPNDGRDVFTLDTYTMIEFAYVDDGLSQVWALREDRTKKIVRFRTIDYHTMISDIVIFDTGNPNRTVKCEFRNKDDAKEFYGFLRPNDRPFHKRKYGVISVLQYDCIRAGCGNRTCDVRSCGVNYHDVSAKGTIYTETLTRAANDRPLMKRFTIRGEDGTTNMVFTSKAFNITPLENYECYVYNNDDLDRDIPLNIPNLWQHLFPYPAAA